MLLTSILVIRYMLLSRTPAPQQITSWHLGWSCTHGVDSIRRKSKLALEVLGESICFGEFFCLFR